jgi:hypothetical protein
MPLEVRIILTVVSDKIDHRQELSHSLVASPAGNSIAVISTSSLIHQRIRGLKVELNPTSRTSYCRPASVSKSLDQTLQTAMPVALWIDRIRIHFTVSTRKNGHFMKNGHLSVPTLRVLKKIQIHRPYSKHAKNFAPQGKMNASEALRKA